MMNKQCLFIFIAMLSVEFTRAMETGESIARADSYANLLSHLTEIEGAIGRKNYDEVQGLIEGKDYSKKKIPPINNPLYLSVACNQVKMTQDLFAAGLLVDNRVIEIVDDIENDAARALLAAVKKKMSDECN